MKYMLLIYGNDDTWNALHDEGIEQVLDRHRQLTEELKEIDAAAFKGYEGLLWPGLLDRWLY